MRFAIACQILSLIVPAMVLRADDGATKARTLVHEWIEKGASVKSLEIDFVQERRLKALRMPLSRKGRIWFQRPESFRWQISEPPALIAIRKSGGDLSVADTAEKTIRVWTAAELAAETGNGKGHGLAMAVTGFPASADTFEQAFEIRSARETSTPGVWEVRLDLHDRKAGLFVKEIVFTIQPDDGSLKKFDVFMRDGSIMTTRVINVKKDQALPASVFQFDEAGYTMQKK